MYNVIWDESEHRYKVVTAHLPVDAYFVGGVLVWTSHCEADSRPCIVVAQTTDYLGAQHELQSWSDLGPLSWRQFLNTVRQVKRLPKGQKIQVSNTTQHLQNKGRIGYVLFYGEAASEGCVVCSEQPPGGKYSSMFVVDVGEVQPI